MTVITSEIPRVLAEVQGNVLHGYRLPNVRHSVVRVADPARARAALARLLGGGPGPAVTPGDVRDPAGPTVNVGVTWLGLQALGVPDTRLATFPIEFREGMTARAARLGDLGASAPDRWVEPFNRPRDVHLVLTVHAASAAAAQQGSDEVLAAAGRGFAALGAFDGEALVDAGGGRFDLASNVEGGPSVGRRGEHFGFRDGFAQPRFEGDGRGDEPGRERREPLGIVLLGHPTRSRVAVRVPEPGELGHQGSFNAFRVLAQDVGGFRRFVAATAAALGIDGELLKAKMCGRWPNGVPLSMAETARDAEAVADGAEPRALDAFDFSDDQDGRVCPVGSHIRRANPRAAHLVQRPANRERRLVRRGMPFGPWLAEGEEPRRPRERGLLGSFLCASLSSQFEAMQADWLHLGLQDPSITSTNDPLVGANDGSTGAFQFFAEGEWRTVRGLPSFVQTMGGAYLFVPSMKGLEWIASGREA